MTRRLLSLAFVVLALCMSPVVAAQSPAEREAAVALGEEALKLYEQGRWPEAYERFEKADRMVHAPPLVLYMARSQRNMGKLAEALELYQRLVDEEIHELAPEQFLAAKKKAGQDLQVLKARVPFVVIRVEGVPAADVRVSVDGAELKPGRLASPVPLNPGTHQIEASAKGFGSAEATVELTEGSGTQTVALSLTPEEGGSGQGPEPGLSEPDQATGQGPWWPAAVAFGVGAVGLTLGAITGGLAMSKADDIKSRCIDDHCPPEDEDQGDSAATLATVSTVGFIVGGVAATTGVVLLVWRPGGSEDTGQPPDATARLRVGPASLQLSGVF